MGGGWRLDLLGLRDEGLGSFGWRVDGLSDEG